MYSRTSPSMSSRMYPRVVLLAGIVAAAMILGGLAACQSMPDKPAPPGPVQITTIMGPSDIISAAWINDDWLVVQKDRPGAPLAFSNELWKMRPDGTELQKLDLPDRSGCTRNAFRHPFRLPDGRLGYMVSCESDADGKYYQYMMAYDLQTGETEALIVSPLLKIGTGGWHQSWNPEMTRAIVPVHEYELTSHLYWFTSDDWQPLNLDFGTDFGAAWSSDGAAIVFWASASEVTRENHTVAHSLYVMEPDGSSIRLLAEGPFYQVAGMVWSPNSEWLAFTAATPGTGESSDWEYKVWLLERETGKLHVILCEPIGVVDWSPDGTQLSGVRFVDPLVSDDKEIVIIDLSSILQLLVSEEE
jgi:hypothetical protein